MGVRYDPLKMFISLANSCCRTRSSPMGKCCEVNIVRIWPDIPHHENGYGKRMSAPLLSKKAGCNNCTQA